MIAACPTNKKCFDNQKEAQEFSDSLHAKYGGIHQRVYECDRCPSWHLTTQDIQSNVSQTPIYSTATLMEEVTGKELYEKYTAGMKIRALSEKYGIPAPTIYTRLNKYRVDNGLAFTRNKHQAVTLTQVTLKFQEQEARVKKELAGLEELRALVERLTEQHRIKFELLDGQLTIRRDSGEIVLSLDEFRTLYEEINAGVVVPA